MSDTEEVIPVWTPEDEERYETLAAQFHDQEDGLDETTFQELDQLRQRREEYAAHRNAEEKRNRDEFNRTQAEEEQRRVEEEQRRMEEEQRLHQEQEAQRLAEEQQRAEEQEAEQRRMAEEEQRRQAEKEAQEADRQAALKNIQREQKARNEAQFDLNLTEDPRDDMIRKLQAELEFHRNTSQTQTAGAGHIDYYTALRGDESVISQKSSTFPGSIYNHIPIPRSSLRNPRRQAGYFQVPVQKVGDVLDKVLEVDPKALRPTVINAYRRAKNNCSQLIHDIKTLPDRDLGDINELKRQCIEELDNLTSAFRDIWETLCCLDQAGPDVRDLCEELDSENRETQIQMDRAINYCQNVQKRIWFGMAETQMKSQMTPLHDVNYHLQQMAIGDSEQLTPFSGGRGRGRGGNRGRGLGRGNGRGRGNRSNMALSQEPADPSPESLRNQQHVTPSQEQYFPFYGELGDRSNVAPSHHSFMGSHVNQTKRGKNKKKNNPNHVPMQQTNVKFVDPTARRRSNNRDFVPDNSGEPFDPYRREEPNDFYKSLPPPWNVVPSETVGKGADFWKLLQTGMIHFNGTREGYIPFRSAFLNCVHRMNLNLSYKVMALTSALDMKVPELQELVSMAQHTPEGYRDVICALESEYGGRDRLVAYHIAKLASAPNVKENDKRTLQIISRCLHNYLNTLEGYGMATEVESSLLFKTIKEKLPKSYFLQYSRDTKINRANKSVQSLLAWIDSVLDDIIEMTDLQYSRSLPRDGDQKQTSTPVQSTPKRNHNAFNVNELNEEEITALNTIHDQKDFECELDKEKHPIWKCEKFLKMSPEARRKFTYTNRRCLSCLRKGHFIKDCPNKFWCRKCKKSHNTLLHGTRPDHAEKEKKTSQATLMAVEEESQASESEAEQESEVVDIEECQHSSSATDSTSHVSLRVVPGLIISPDNKNKIKINILLDDGNQKPILSERSADKLQLKGTPTVLNMAVAGGVIQRHQSRIVEFTVKSLDGNFSQKITAKVIPKPTVGYKPIDWNKEKIHWPHLRGLSFPEVNDQEEIDLIIGNEYPNFSKSMAEVCGVKDKDPLARLTPLGWTAIGAVKGKSDNYSSLTQSFLIKHIEEQSILFSKQLESESPFAVKQFGCSPFNKSYRKSCIGNRSNLALSCGDSQESNIAVDQDDRINSTSGDRPNMALSDHESPGSLAPMAVPETWNIPKAELDTELTEILKRQYILDYSPNDEDQAMSPEDVYALEQLKKTRKKLEKGYEVGVIWRENEPNLPNNRFMAEQRLLGVEKSLKRKDTAIQEEYQRVFRDWISKGYIVKVPREDKTEKVNYLAHFPVIEMQRQTTKIRVVVDGSAQYDGKSLNDAVYAGPNFINDLCKVLLRFRRNHIAVCGDVSQMYLRVKMKPEDRPFHRILWRESEDQPIETYEFTVFPFGNPSSGSVAIFVVKEHAEEHKAEYPRAAEMIIKSSLVDDNLDSVDTEDEALDLINGALKLYNECDMAWRKIASNSEEVMKSVPESERGKSRNITGLAIGNQFVAKTLGAIWLAEDDRFTFHMEDPEIKEWTKRKLCSTHAQLFDPLGLIAPFTITARILLQQCWREDVNWDEEVPPEVLKKWQKWIDSLPELQNLRFDRCLKGKDTRGKIISLQEIHTFADASGKAYSAASYIRTIFTDRTVHVALAFAKARVAPIQFKSIPRLELTACDLAVDLMRKVNNVFQIEKEHLYFWTDSVNALCWIQSETKSLKIFAANKVSKIHDATLKKNWRWTPTDQNPPDLATRGMNAKDLVDNQFWSSGPKFLISGEFPTQPDIHRSPTVLKEMKNIEHVLTLAGVKKKEELPANHPQKFETLRKALWFNSTYVLLQRILIAQVKKKDPPRERLDPENLDLTMRSLVYWSQRESFPETFIQLKEGSVKSSNPLISLQPGIAENEGVIRMFSRLSKVEYLDFEARCPIILSSKHPLTVLIIKNVHVCTLKHTGGIDTTLAQVNKKYWVIGGRELVKKILRKCLHCRRRLEKPVNQIMSPLPDFRVSEGTSRLEAFDTTAIDCAGPFIAKGRRGRPKAGGSERKRWLLLFVCCQYRCVHIEKLDQMDTPSFLMAFSRFIARRNRPKRMVSDGGKNFVGGENVLKELMNVLDSEEAKRMFPEIDWWTNCPAAPHTGGHFEALIKSTKSALYKIIGTGELNDEELATAFAITEGLLNSRPLSYVSQDGKDPEPLTPGHFIRGGDYVDLAPVPENWSLKSRWHHIQKLMDHFWQRFILEYVPKLNKMPKWYEERTMQKNDVVIVFEEKIRGVWPLGIIEEVHRTSIDDKPRSVVVRFNGHSLVRPIHKVYPIPLSQ